MTEQPTTALDIRFPAKMLGALFNKPYPTFRVFYGGRSASKSWSIIRFLIIQAAQTKLRILCCREFLSAVDESVHQTITEQINNLQLSHIFKVEKGVIRCTETGSEFLFAGIRNNIDAIRSMESINITFIVRIV